jgi:NADH-quinone oxidoreductase subunit G
MVFRYGAGESRFTETKLHVDEQQWSPVVFFDAPRCILCFRCVRACDEGMGVKALGVINRGAFSLIAPNEGDHLECDECGQCIDICPVGALTSGAYRYQTRPWEMEHVGTICTHCSNGCKTTLGVATTRLFAATTATVPASTASSSASRAATLRFLRSRGALAVAADARGRQAGRSSWSKALERGAKKFNEIARDGGKFGVIGSNHTTNEENFYLQKFARKVLGTKQHRSSPHRRRGDAARRAERKTGKLATVQISTRSKAFLILGADLALEHPFLSFQIRANHRHHEAHVYVPSRRKRCAKTNTP